MLRASLSARISAVVTAVVLTPLAIGLVSLGGTAWYEYVARGGLAPSYGTIEDLLGVEPLVASGFPVAQTLLLVLGLILLLAVVGTGYLSSLGLLATGLPGVVATLAAVYPAPFADVFGPIVKLVPFAWSSMLQSGVAAPIHWVLFGAGLALLWERRRASTSGVGMGVAGGILVPLLLLGSAWLALDGVQRTTRPGILQLMGEPMFIGPLEVFAAGLIAVIALVATRWSPYALVVPGFVLIAVGIVAMVPVIGPALVAVVPQSVGEIAEYFVYLGGTLSLGVVMLAFTGLLVATRHRARS